LIFLLLSRKINQHTIRINNSHDLHDLPWSNTVGISHIYWCAIRGIYDISNILQLGLYDTYNSLLCSVLQYDHYFIYSNHLWTLQKKKRGIYGRFFSRWFYKPSRKQNLQMVFSKLFVKNLLWTVWLNRP